MIKRIYFVYCIFILCIFGQIQAVTFLNNVTVPSDILNTIFLKYVENENYLRDIPYAKSNIYDSEKCITGLREIIKRFPSFDVLPFFDAWGKIPSGLLNGHLQDLGNYEQCLKISTVLSDQTGLIKGQYCFVSIPLIKDQNWNISPLRHNSRIQSRIYEELLRISVAMCVPHTCDPRFLTEIFRKATTGVLNGALSDIIVDRCEIVKKPEFKMINIVGIIFFSVIAVLMFMSTAYDMYTNYCGKSKIPLLIAFSVLTNSRKLFAINTSNSPNSIDCLVGIRVLSMVWIIFCHSYSMSPMLPFINFVDFIPWFKSLSSMHVIMATVSVDTFFFISGLLLAWLGFRELDKRNGKLNIFQMYFHRYIRLTPPVAAVVLYFLSIDEYVGSGPIREVYKTLNGGCKSNWWTTLLYIQNYINPLSICVSQTWYLAVDTQLYILSPLFLISLWKWGRKFVPVMIILSMLSVGCVIASYFKEGFKSFMGVLEDDQVRLTYSPTHTRYTVWLIGIGTGYFMYKNKDKKAMYPPLSVQILGWILCLTTIAAIIYGPYFTINADRATTTLEAALYESLRRVSWGIILAWIVFSCHFGFGSLVNSFLSHPCWQPMGRLTYSMYLVHLAVQSINYGTIRTDVYFSDFTLIQFFWSTFGLSIIAATFLTLAFESPILAMEKALLRSSNKKNKEIKKIQEEISQNLA